MATATATPPKKEAAKPQPQAPAAAAAGEENKLTPAEVTEIVKRLSGAQKAAVLLVAIGTEAASAVIKHLNDDEVERISVEIARMRNTASEVVEGVLLEFRDLGWAQEFIAQGGVTFARDALAAALGTRRAEEIMMRVEAAMEVSAFHLLQTVETSQLTSFLQNEHPQTAALILAHLNPRKSAEIISNFEAEVQNEIIFRLATMGKTSPALLSDVEEVIRQQIGSLFGTELSAAGGIEAVAQILNNTSRAAEKNILEGLTERDNDLAMSIKALMFVFDDLVNISDRDLQRILVEVEQRDLALSLKGASENLKAKMLGNISQRAADGIREELELMGPVRVSDVEESQRRIIEVAQQLEEQEEISLSRGGQTEVLL
ncbi:MAG: flagellar motor switch protein FliG [Rhodothermales bacterium]|nr:flagellar motor switch protein FliG [Rhodothermales bacterium]